MDPQSSDSKRSSADEAIAEDKIADVAPPLDDDVGPDARDHNEETNEPYCFPGCTGCPECVAESDVDLDDFDDECYRVQLCLIVNREHDPEEWRPLAEILSGSLDNTL